MIDEGDCGAIGEMKIDDNNSNNNNNNKYCSFLLFFENKESMIKMKTERERMNDR
jgi:hypothetical protein